MYYYCPYCGATQMKANRVCVNCHSNMTTIQSKHEMEYYKNKSKEKYGNETHIREFLLPEIRINPLFDENKYQEKYTGIPRNWDKNNITQNVAKCPTCGSTNLKKISAISKATHAYAFGLFSKTARSQFECRNCGYKW